MSIATISNTTTCPALRDWLLVKIGLQVLAYSMSSYITSDGLLGTDYLKNLSRRVQVLHYISDGGIMQTSLNNVLHRALCIISPVVPI